MRSQTKFGLLCCALAVAGSASTAFAAGTNLISTNVVGGNTGWFSSGVWKTNNGAGVPVGNGVSAPVPGNTYALIQGPNPAIGNNLAETRTRNPYTNGTPNPVVFPGDSLTLNTNTEIRFKRVAAGNVPRVDFPGVGGNPGLILNGGMLNTGDPDVFPISGIIQAAPGSQSYICPGNNDFAGVENSRGFNISASIVGSGTLVVVQGGTTAVNISGSNNTYSGTWQVKAGLLLGSAPGSLGTNSSFVIDPYFTLPVPPLDATSANAANGPAILEPSYDLNSAGTLTLVNGGQMRLHQNCAFTAVTIEGQALTPGTHYYSELNSRFAANFPAGSGAITVKSYGPLPVVVTTLPLPQMVYAGRTAHFTAVGAGPGVLTYQWRKGGVNLTDGGNISGATTTNLVISNVSSSDQANYDVLVSNGADSSSCPAVALTVVTPSGEPYEAAVLAANPAVFYQLNETGEPATSPYAFDYVGGGVGNYGVGTQNGSPTYNIAGPTATAGFTGFAAANKAVQLTRLTVGSRVTVAPWNLNTDTVTLTAWINPNAVGQGANEGLIFCRGGGTVAGLNYSASTDAMGNMTLGYTWNNELETYTWDSGIAPPAGQWSLVALVVTPTSATIHVMNTNGFLQSSRTYNHVPQSFAGTTLIGDDSNAADGSRAFNGTIDDVAVFTTALTKDQLTALYAAGLGTTPNYAPLISMQPASTNMWAGQTATFRVVGGGTEPLTYQWMKGAIGSGVYANVSDGGKISGATTASLVISNVADADALEYVVVLANAFGSVTSAPAATLTVYPTYPAEQILMAGVLQPGTASWETGASWSDFNPASLSAAMKPGSTYRLTPTNGFNTRMRSPEGPRTAVFPGSVLYVDGTGVFTNNPGTNGATSEIRFKQPNPGRIIFPKLVMNGGQLDTGNDGIAEVGGLIEIRTNTPFYNDGGADRGYLISAQLTGSGTIGYWGYNQTSFRSNYVNNLNIACPSNTFKGAWNVVLGTLLGTAPGALGTNDITVGVNGALETTYDVSNPSASLYLFGRMYLHQNDTFQSLFVNGVPLAVGTYTFAQLNAAYPTNFPATWMPQIGATNYTTGSGSITVLVQPAPEIVQQPVSVSKYPTETAQFTVTAAGNPPLYYRWRKAGVPLSDTGNISGSTTNVLTITNIAPANAGNYDVVVTNSVGSVTSLVAVLTVLPTGPALNLTLNYDYSGSGTPAPIMQPQNNDWNTITNWSDGQPASISALSNPGSTYEVVAGARLRTPVNDVNILFPGNRLSVDGDGVWVNNGSTTIGEIRFKHSNPSTYYFKKLVMNGGQLDSGDNGLTTIAGWMEVLANTPIYADSAAGQDRPYQIDAWLTGNGSIEFHQWGAGFGGNLNITGTSNTFSGTWNIVQGCVLGSGLGSLGTNTIFVGTNGSVAALETLYDIYSPQGSLIVDTAGQVFLHQNDTFKAVTVAGTPLAPGTYTFAQLNATYPANFPASWPLQMGSTLSTGSGSLTVLGDAPPQITLQYSISGGNMTLTWSQGTLLEANDVVGPWVTNNSPSPFTIQPNGPRKFYRVQVR